jgi:hypothetical protein
MKYYPVLTAIFVCTCFCALDPVPAATFRVAQDGSGGPGSNWSNAYTIIQSAIAAASSGDEIWVKQGWYTENITLANGVLLYGGFDGTETLLAQRDWKGKYGDTTPISRPLAESRIIGVVSPVFHSVNGAR